MEQGLVDVQTKEDGQAEKEPDAICFLFRDEEIGV